jgi:hypothetical protein
VQELRFRNFPSIIMFATDPPPHTKVMYTPLTENEGNEGDNEVNYEENQLKTYKDALIYIKNLE